MKFRESIEFIPPSYFVGWREGMPFDTSECSRHNFFYPKKSSRYKILFEPEVDYFDDDFLSSMRKKRGNSMLSHAIETLNSIRTKGLDETIKVFQVGKEFIVLDGALRLSCISMIRSEERPSGPVPFEKVPVSILDGTFEKAQFAMFELQTNRKRDLLLSEQVVFVKTLLDSGMEKSYIKSQMNWDNRSYKTIEKFIGVSDEAIEKIDRNIEKFRSGFGINDDAISDFDEVSYVESEAEKLGGPVRKKIVRNAYQLFCKHLENIENPKVSRFVLGSDSPPELADAYLAMIEARNIFQQGISEYRHYFKESDAK
jgi:hypothetical protein